MADLAQLPPRRRAWFFWGLGASLLLHALFVLPLLIHPPKPAQDPSKEESISVSLVPPEEKKKEPEKPVDFDFKVSEKPEKPKPAPAKPEAAKPAEPKPPAPKPAAAKPQAAAAPQAFESAARDEQAEKSEETPSQSQSDTEKPGEGMASEATKGQAAAGLPDRQTPPQPPALPQDVKPPEASLPPQATASPNTAQTGGGIVTEQRFSVSEEGSDVPPVPQAKPAPQAGGQKAPALKPAKRVYSKDMLSDPHVREALGKLPPQRRIVQICSIEMLEQIRRSVPGSFPDVITGSPGTQEKISARLMDVQGAAYRSQGRWFDISYRCETDEKTSTITAFSFQIGAEIPRSAWQARRLPTH
ncbi:DUF930 domain-containing protein [Rhizobium paknamense]|uniref:DUF930 domain-containing protein n=1 Tax=Rhizobium paknamense TaxID=1206817 RepID=A0ABU0IAP3_9HYPH|nr:DUF930 domain-containing protein [Rhizobium paknamense]MDQ0454565.1 hypothetical protein [Rhizobium paknamense]